MRRLSADEPPERRLRPELAAPQENLSTRFQVEQKKTRRLLMAGAIGGLVMESFFENCWPSPADSPSDTAIEPYQKGRVMRQQSIELLEFWP
jgi:hypothetical protein